MINLIHSCRWLGTTRTLGPQVITLPASDTDMLTAQLKTTDLHN